MEVNQQPQEIGKFRPEAAPGQFRFSAKAAALTYPRCPLPRKDLITFFVNLGAKIVVVAQERHHDQLVVPGDESNLAMSLQEEDFVQTHLHAYVEWPKQFDSRNPRVFDIAGYHPHIRTAWKREGWLRYIKKEDQEYLLHGAATIEELEGPKRRSIRDEICLNLLTKKKTLQETIMEYPGELYELDKLQRNLDGYEALKKERSLKDFKPQNCNKRRHWWIWGKSNTGKTTSLKGLIAKDPEKWYQIPTNDDWYKYGQEPYLYLDEFKGKLTIQEINRICDGDTKVNVKFSRGQICPYPTVVIVSNKTIGEVYVNCEEDILETLHNRFTSIEAVPANLNPDWIKPVREAIYGGQDLHVERVEP